MKKFAYLLLLFITMHSCKKDCIDKENYFAPVRPEMKSSIPYQDGQIVKFKRGGETYSFAVDFNLDTVKYPMRICEECCEDTLFENVEELLVELYDSIHRFRFTFYSDGLTPHYMFLDVNAYVGEDEDGSEVHYSMESEGIFTCDYNPFISGNGTVCHDTITIGTTLYHNVVEIKNGRGWVAAVRQVFYSQEKGILKVTWWFSSTEDLILVE